MSEQPLVDRRILSAEPKPLDPEHQELLNRIVRDAWEKVRAQEKG